MKKEMDNVFVRFSNNVFEKYQGTNRIRYFMVIMAMRREQTVRWRVKTSVEEIMASCGCKPDAHASVINQYRMILSEISNGDYGTKSNVPDWMQLSLRHQFILYVPPNSSLFFANSNFTVFTDAEFTKIAKDAGNVSHFVMAGVYLYLKRFMNEKEREPAYPTMNKICAGTGLSETTVKSAIGRLKGIGLLYSDHYYVIGDDDKPYNTINVYTNDESVLRDSRRIAKLLSDRVYRGQKVIPSSNTDGDNHAPVSEAEKQKPSQIDVPIEETQTAAYRNEQDVDLHNVDLSSMNTDSIVRGLYLHEDWYCEDRKFIESLPDSVIKKLSSFTDIPTVLEMVAKQEHWRRQKNNN